MDVDKRRIIIVVCEVEARDPDFKFEFQMCATRVSTHVRTLDTSLYFDTYPVED